MTGHVPTRGNTYYNTVGNIGSFEEPAGKGGPLAGRAF
jgi:hypothetical protein